MATNISRPGPIILIHGGAGVIPRESLSPQKEKEVRRLLAESAMTGHNILKDGGTSLEAVVRATKVLEDSEHFNAGKGSVFTRNGIQEMDAGLMCGRSGKCGCVSGLRMIRNPILAAEAVLHKCPHPYLSGPSAEEYLTQLGIECVTSVDYFYTQFRWDQLKSFLKTLETNPDAAGKVDHDIPVNVAAVDAKEKLELSKQTGTVGAVALDSFGNLASSSSTGGITGKMDGRVSDSSIPGAGFWADKRVAVSMTGFGDRFVETCAAHQLAAELEFTDHSLSTAADDLIHKKLAAQSAGLIALDCVGRWVMPYNSGGMYRAVMGAEFAGGPMVGIWREFQ